MRIEHIAFMVHDPVAVAAWYVQHLGFSVKRSMSVPPLGHFLADSSGKVMIEIYHNPAAAVIDYAATNPLSLHLAFVSSDVVADRDRLLAAGCTVAGDLIRADNGDVIAMLRDPWQLPIQLCQRGTAMV